MREGVRGMLMAGLFINRRRQTPDVCAKMAGTSEESPSIIIHLLYLLTLVRWILYP